MLKLPSPSDLIRVISILSECSQALSRSTSFLGVLFLRMTAENWRLPSRGLILKPLELVYYYLEKVKHCYVQKIHCLTRWNNGYNIQFTIPVSLVPICKDR